MLNHFTVGLIQAIPKAGPGLAAISLLAANLNMSPADRSVPVDRLVIRYPPNDSVRSLSEK